jgi:Protein of unknown function (DUF3307)
MTWPAVLLVLLVSHAAGDVLLQTNRQAGRKGGGIDDPRARGALLAHVSVYTLAYVPALVWIAAHTSPGRAVLVGAMIAVPHLIIDEGRLVRAWLREVKRAPDPPPALVIAVDQCLHLLCLAAAALTAVA